MGLFSFNKAFMKATVLGRFNFLAFFIRASNCSLSDVCDIFVGSSDPFDSFSFSGCSSKPANIVPSVIDFGSFDFSRILWKELAEDTAQN